MFIFIQSDRLKTVYYYKAYRMISFSDPVPHTRTFSVLVILTIPGCEMMVTTYVTPSSKAQKLALRPLCVIQRLVVCIILSSPNQPSGQWKHSIPISWHNGEITAETKHLLNLYCLLWLTAASSSWLSNQYFSFGVLSSRYWQAGKGWTERFWILVNKP